jgi:hypothetical protein
MGFGNAIHATVRFASRNGVMASASSRLGNHYRAVGFRDGNVIAWFRIGSHADDNRFRF